MNEKKLVRWPYLLMGFMIFLFIGLIYAWSIFVVPLEQAFGWIRSDTSNVFSVVRLLPKTFLQTFSAKRLVCPMHCSKYSSLYSFSASEMISYKFLSVLFKKSKLVTMYINILINLFRNLSYIVWGEM